jgi:hypothetical protein
MGVEAQSSHEVGRLQTPWRLGSDKWWHGSTAARSYQVGLPPAHLAEDSPGMSLRDHRRKSPDIHRRDYTLVWLAADSHLPNVKSTADRQAMGL